MVSRCTGGAGGQGVGYECNIAAVSCQEPPPAPAPGHLGTNQSSRITNGTRNLTLPRPAGRVKNIQYF